MLDKLGIKNSKFYAKDIDKSVLIVSTSSYKRAIDNEIKIKFGSLGENVLVDFDINELKIGNKVQICNAILEITQDRSICKSFTKIHKNLAKTLKNKGIFAKVLQAGEITTNSPFRII